MDAQTSRGFAHVPDAVCELYLKSKGKEIPEVDDEYNYRTVLQIACITATKPGLTDVEVAGFLNSSFLDEHAELLTMPLVDVDDLGDVLNPGEARNAKVNRETRNASEAMRALAAHTRAAFLPKYAKKTKGPKPKAGVGGKKGPKWIAAKDEENVKSITEWIRNNGPEGVSVHVDETNGRWRVMSPLLQWRSIAWTKRGYEKAAAETLHQAWVYYQEHTGFEPPFPLAELAKKFRDDVGIA